MKPNFALFVCLVGLSLSSRAAELKQKTTAAFDKYVAATEARIHSDLRPGGIFLYVDALQADAMKSSYDKLMKGEVLVEQRKTNSPGLSADVPDGMVHHWIGIIFIPGVTLAQVLPIVQDYDRRAELYKPDVIAAHLISHQGDDYRFFLRLYQKRFTTVIFNTEYVTHWGQVDPHKTYSHSISTRIAEVKDPDQPDSEEWPVGQGRGYLWRLNTYWRFEEKDNGVYIQCEALSLTRDIPFGLGWLLKPLVTKIPRESLNRALGQTRAAVLESSSRLKMSTVLFHHFDFRSVADHLPLLCFVQHSSQRPQSATWHSRPSLEISIAQRNLRRFVRLANPQRVWL